MSTPVAWGASASEWGHFADHLGLSEDLLPVVSNPTGVISRRSKITTLGKTPSLYNGAREVMGIGNWTNLRPNAAKVTAWSQNGDYGICLQTRDVRAFDLDVGDPVKSNAIAAFIEEHLNIGPLPVRRRSNSGKMLQVVRVEGDIAKRSVPVDGGVIEFLASGQQFVAVGTHPSGVRYEWHGGLPAVIPTISIEQYNALWVALVERFAVGDARGGGDYTPRQRGERMDVDDPVADHLEQAGLVLSETADGRVLVTCPWESGHSSGAAGDSSTVWFRAGTNEHERGHFSCLHASCGKARTDSAFMEAIGYVEPAEVVIFEPVVEELTVEEMEEAPPVLRRANGFPVNTIENVVAALRKPKYCGMQIRFDAFRDEIMCAEPGGDQWMQFTDAKYVELRIMLAQVRRFRPGVGRDLIRDAVLLVATENPFDSALTWLDQQRWDGQPRVERFLSTYIGVEDSRYTRAVSRYIWSAMAGRVIEPGCKADMVPILIGNQGARKSTAVKYMVPSEEFFTELSFDEKDDDLARKMRGRLMGELGELRGLHTKELESIKAFITRTHEHWVPKYREFATKFPRRLVFIGTTNQHEFLADETGNRRWLPVRVGEVIDTDSIKRDCNQLWAEAAVAFTVAGVDYQEVEGLAPVVHADHFMSDPWEPAISAWLACADPMTGVAPSALDVLFIADVLTGALSIDLRHVKRYEEMRVGKVLQALGYTRKQIRVGAARRWGYAR